MLVSFIGRKGGVGKTTLCVNLAGHLAESRSVAILDCDPQLSAFGWISERAPFPVEHASGVGRITGALDRLEPTVDVVLADSPPLDAEVAAALFARSDLTVIPLTPSGLDIRAAAPLLEAIRDGGRKGLAVLTMTDARTNATRQAREALEGFGVPVARTAIASRVAHREATVLGAPVLVTEPSSLAASEIRALGKEVVKILRRVKA